MARSTLSSRVPPPHYPTSWPRLPTRKLKIGAVCLHTYIHPLPGPRIYRSTNDREEDLDQNDENREGEKEKDRRARAQRGTAPQGARPPRTHIHGPRGVTRVESCGALCFMWDLAFPKTRATRHGCARGADLFCGDVDTDRSNTRAGDRTPTLASRSRVRTPGTAPRDIIEISSENRRSFRDTPAAQFAGQDRRLRRSRLWTGVAGMRYPPCMQ
jgi:hypothetical protein